jgi:serine/threonine-protein phosphatase PP1 catalytic subunit
MNKKKIQINYKTVNSINIQNGGLFSLISNIFYPSSNGTQITEVKDATKELLDLEKEERIKINSQKMVLSLYEYELIGYISDIDKNIQHRFNPLIKSKDIDCNSIIVKDNINGYTSSRIISTCDLLDSNPTVLSDDIVQKVLNSNSMLSLFKEIYENLPARVMLDDIPIDLLRKMESSCSIMTEKCERIKAIYDDMYKLNIDKMKENSYILHLEHNDKDRIIVLGDIHGSFHTFLRILVRLHLMNVLNLTTWKINDGYKIIFLGDVVDRGKYSLEVVISIFTLILENNDDLLQPKVIYNRGNHEEKEINGRDGLSDELSKKCNKLGTTIHEQMNNLFKYFSSAILFKYKNGKIWFSHGGIPTNSLNLDLNQTIHNITILPNSELQSEIRWNDFGINKETKINNARGIGFVIGLNYLSEFLINHDIQLICRGHQDNRYNSYILGTEEEKIPLNRKITTNNSSLIFIDNDNYIHFDRRFKGPKPMRKIIVDNIKSGELIKYDDKNITINPVITISTNTDYQRDLSSDSFVIFGLEIV